MQLMVRIGYLSSISIPSQYRAFIFLVIGLLNHANVSARNARVCSYVLAVKKIQIEFLLKSVSTWSWFLSQTRSWWCVCGAMYWQPLMLQLSVYCQSENKICNFFHSFWWWRRRKKKAYCFFFLPPGLGVYIWMEFLRLVLPSSCSMYTVHVQDRPWMMSIFLANTQSKSPQQS